jgi:hypothetical protein
MQWPPSSPSNETDLLLWICSSSPPAARQSFAHMQRQSWDAIPGTPAHIRLKLTYGLISWKSLHFLAVEAASFSFARAPLSESNIA